ncbi:uncharacterized protein LOC123013867 [Tribolium madens]|uniref:uncharacterized protein LOC123013867 n=1 Tax=Tribolium madens TaxID=41895 RepID=UPI001CF7295F|nr:uncharacterized protein LOC123013867 [Tribolium madens]
MSLNHQDSEIGQSPGCDPKASKRNSGLFAFLKWFKPSTSRESIDTQNSSSCESLNSVQSSGTVASFSYVPPGDYTNKVSEKCIILGPETDTYRARLKQRDKRRENDKNVTLRKKYNLFFNRDTLLKPVKKDEDDENTKSLPLMTRPSMEEEEKSHRRTNSESSKTKKAGAYLHVKGKRRAPQPPTTSTMSLRRKKRLAPAPPSLEKIKNTPESEIIFNDSLKLDHGILKPAKETTSETKSSVCETPVSPRPWYKRTPSSKVEEKRKSGMSFLTNISELDREASEIVRKEHQKNGNDEIPQFMRPKEDTKINTDSWVSPKRRSAKDLIAKFNAITSVTKATVFGVSQNQKKDYFGRRTSLLTEERKQESLLENHKKRIEQIDRKINPLMKSESASAIKPKPETPKIDRKNWNCPKCSIENDYWRIICHVCSTIKPYFDDFSATKSEEKPPEKPPEKAFERAKTQIGFSALASYNLKKKIEKSVSLDEEKVDKSEEREKLKKMLIEMKNSLPKRKSNILMKQNSRQSVIEENPEQDEKTEDKSQEEKVVEIIIGTTETIYENIKVKKSETPKPVKISVSAQTSAVQLDKKGDSELSEKTPKPILRKETTKFEQEKKSKEASKPEHEGKNNLEATKMEQEKKTNFELMRPKDFESIYSDPNGQSPARIYANLARNDELSLFFNMPKRLTDLKNNLQDDKNTDTIEINRLLRRLETSIAKGELTEAAIYAKELAQLKVNCSVVRQKPVNSNGKKQGFSIEMFVEDKISHRGPFPLEVTENQTVAELKTQVEREFEIPVNVQRWILGKELVTDDSSTLKDHKITTERCPVFLYLVAPDGKSECKISKSEEVPSTSKEKVVVNRIPKIVEVIPKVIQEKKIEVRKSLVEPTPTTSTSQLKNEDSNKLAEPEEDLEDYDSKTLKPGEWECHLCTLLNPISSNICAVCATVRQKDLSPIKRFSKKKAPQPQADQTYLQLVNLDNKDLVENREPFECLVCFMEIAPGDGVTLRECLHQFCKFCLAHTVEYTEDAEVKCPYRDEQYSCNIALQDREIKALVTPQIYEHYLAKSVSEAENKIGKSFHCKTPDCKGWCIFEDNVNEFRCPVCRKMNCLTCQAIHSGLNCKQYQEKMTQESEVDEDARRTKEMVNEMVKNGEALTCPTCQVILMKKWGCDWVRCSMCKTEICWVTRGPRWGPGGKGDTSGGCQCGVNGVKCHPKCSYCH